jgi:hypothetical protein
MSLHVDLAGWMSFLHADGQWWLKVMDEGTLKTPTPLCRFHWSFCLGWWSSLVGSASGQKQCKIPAEYGLHSTIHPPTSPPPLRHSLCINSTFSLGRGGGGQREDRGATVQKYSSFVHGGNSSQAGSKIPTNEWMYFQSIKSVKHNAEISVTRSIFKKSRHIGIGLLQCNLSTLKVKYEFEIMCEFLNAESIQAQTRSVRVLYAESTRR